MGYTSEVSLTIENAAFTELLKKAKIENADAFELIETAAIYQTDKFTTLHFDSVKWYEDYGDVRFIEDFMRSVPYVFKRIGESSDDTEELCGDVSDYGMYDCVYLIRSLDVENAGNRIILTEQEAA